MKVKVGPMTTYVPDHLLAGIPEQAARSYVTDCVEAAVLRHLMDMPTEADALMSKARRRLGEACLTYKGDPDAANQEARPDLH